MKINICTINHNERDNDRVTISYDTDERKLYADGEIIDTPELNSVEAAEDYCNSAWGVDPVGVWGLEWIEREDDGKEIVLKISRINIKTETFCTPWNGQLYCVDICEDAEERSAWLYNSAYGVKSLMWGEDVKNDRDEFLNCVFSNLPSYIEDYADEYEDE